MRLIDADALMERITDISNPDMLTIGKVVGIIDTQPIAYDIEKVVEELEKYQNSGLCYQKQNAIETAIEIVKRGGNNGN